MIVLIVTMLILLAAGVPIAYAIGISAHLRQGKGVSCGWDVCLIHGLIRFRLNTNSNIRIIVKHTVNCFNNSFCGYFTVFSFANIRALACEP